MASSRRKQERMVDPFMTLQDKCKVELKELENALLSKGSQERRRKIVTKRCDRVINVLNDLDFAVRAIGRQRAQYQQIDDAEFQRRKFFTKQTRERVREIQKTLKGATNRAKESEAKQRNELLGVSGSDGGYAEVDVDESSMTSAEVLQYHQQEQKQIVKQQDEILDHLTDGVEQLGDQAKAIGAELEEEAKLLAQFEREMEEAQARMNFVLRGLSKLLKTKNTCQLWLILFLLFIIVILAVFVFFVD